MTCPCGCTNYHMSHAQPGAMAFTLGDGHPTHDPGESGYKATARFARPVINRRNGHSREREAI
jgi:hypothetical protein